jgi:hypothetical protein
MRSYAAQPRPRQETWAAAYGSFQFVVKLSTSPIAVPAAVVTTTW